MWEDTVDNMTASCEYVSQSHEFKISVSYKGKTKTKTFKASFEPIFGMDVIDQHQSGVVAEELAKEFEKEDKNEA